LKIAVAITLVAALIAAFFLLPLSRWLLTLVDWVRDAGALGVIVFSVVYVLATVLLAPGSILTIGAGFSYGLLWGTLLISPVSVLAATLAFLLGRTILRKPIERRVASHPKFEAIDRAIGDDAFRIVLLLRLSPVMPFNILNYALGLTRVRLRDYVVASFIGMLPGTFLYVYLGSLVTNAAELAGGHHPNAGPWGQVLFWGGLAATVVVTILITRAARKRIP
jgi:uncharacterized membrane protein YdjX (TVP38/TMEM64 family)